MRNPYIGKLGIPQQPTLEEIRKDKTTVVASGGGGGGGQDLDALFMSGLSLTPLDYYKFDETTGTVAKNRGAGRSDGTYVNTPTLGAVGDVVGETNGGNSVSLDSASFEYIDLGATAKDWVPRLGTTGITFLVNLRDLQDASSWDASIVGVYNASSRSGFEIRNWANNDASRIGARIVDAAGNSYEDYYSVGAGFAPNSAPHHRQAVWIEIFMKGPNQIKMYFDGHQLSAHIATFPLGSASGSFNASAVNPTAGTLNTNGSLSGDARSYIKGRMQRLTVFPGELTAADRKKYMRKATKTDRTGLLYRVVTELSPRTSGSAMKQHWNGSVASGDVVADGDRIAKIPDLSGNNNHALQSAENADLTLDRRGTLKIDSFYGAELDLDNIYQSAGYGTETRRQSYALAGTVSVGAHYSTHVAVCRPSMGNILFIGQQDAITGIGGATGLTVAATNTWGFVHSGARIPASSPLAVTAPGLSVAAGIGNFAVTGAENCIYSNGDYAASATSTTGGAWWDNIGTDFLIGGDSTTSGSLFGGRMQDIVICNAPMPQAVLDEYYAAVLADRGLTAHPFSVSIHGDSVSSGQSATLNRGWHTYLPPRWQYRNVSTGGDRFSHQNTKVDTYTSRLWDASATKKIALISVAVNDLSDGASLATMQSRVATLVSKLLTAGANYVVLMGMPSDQGLDGVGYKAWVATQTGIGNVNKVINLTQVPNLHPDSAGHAIMGADARAVFDTIV